MPSKHNKQEKDAAGTNTNKQQNYSLVAGLIPDGRGDAPRQAEVGQLDAEVRVDEDVGRLDVAVDVLGRVHVVQHVEELAEDGLDLDLRELDLHVKEAGEIVRHVLEDDEEVALVSLPGVYDAVLFAGVVFVSVSCRRRC